MHKFKKGDVVMVVDDQYEEDGLDALASESISGGDLGVVAWAGIAYVHTVFRSSPLFSDSVPCRPCELHYIGRL